MSDDGAHRELFTAGDGGWTRLGALADELIRAASRHVPQSASTPSPSEDVRREVDSWEVCPDEPVPWTDLVDQLATTFVTHTVDVTSPWTIAHLHCPTLSASAATEVLVGALNQSMDTYDQSPAATFLEDHVVRWLGAELGLGDGRSGVFTAGGTASNILAMTLAREHHARRSGHAAMDGGLPAEARRWRILTSDQAHFSIAQAAAMLGLGRRAVVPVASDAAARMRMDALDEAIGRCQDDGDDVLAVVATAGTTDAGAVDPVRAIGERARSVGAWFHVDAAVGSAFLLSERLAPLLDGTELADSVTTDFHKLWWQPIGASALVVRDVAVFDTIREESHYLDRDVDVAAGVLNLVGRSLDTTRRSDVLKVAVGLAATGRKRMAAMVEHLVDTAAAVAERVAANPDLELLRSPETVMVLFRLAPAGVAAAALDDLNTEVQRALFEDGTAVVGRTMIDGVVALKLTFVNPAATVGSTDALLDEIVARAAGFTGRRGATGA